MQELTGKKKYNEGQNQIRHARKDDEVVTMETQVNLTDRLEANCNQASSAWQNLTFDGIMKLVYENKTKKLMKSIFLFS